MSFAQSFNLSTLHWLTVEVSDCYRLEAAWRDVIAPLPNLSTIKFLEGDILGFISVMESPWAATAELAPGSASTSFGNIQGTPFFPVLSTIILWEVDFDPNLDREALEYAAHFALVLKRWPQTHPLRELHIESCTNFIDNDFDFLVRCAPNATVKWDGEEDEQECGRRRYVCIPSTNHIMTTGSPWRPTTLFTPNVDRVLCDSDQYNHINGSLPTVQKPLRWDGLSSAERAATRPGIRCPSNHCSKEGRGSGCSD